jgi:hypothetical protein
MEKKVKKTGASVKNAAKKEVGAKEEKKSQFVLWWESYEPIIEIVDMRAVLK